MRIGLDGSFLHPDSLHTGMGVYTRGLAAGLAELHNGHETILLGYSERPATAPEFLQWCRLPVLRAGRASAWLSHQLALPVAARRLRLDVLHVPGINVRLSRPGVPFWSPCPLVVTMHDAIPLVYYGRHAPPLPWRLRIGFRLGLLAATRAAAIVTVSTAARQDLLGRLCLSPARVTAVPNGLDDWWLNQASDGARGVRRLGIEPPYLLYAGSYEHRKNLLGAVEAYRQALGQRDLPPLVLVVERESGHRTRVMAEVERAGINERLRFIHSLSDEELVSLYRGAHLFVYPSFYEGFGFPPLQALACGIPVIASRAGSLPEVLGDAACYVDPGSPSELAATMLRLLEDTRLARQLAADGPSRAARFTWTAAAQQTLEVYRLAAER